MIFTCMKVANGIVAVLVGELPVKIKDITDVVFELADFGIVVKAGEFEIPIPEVLLDHMIQTGAITIYYKSHESYVAELVCVIELPQQTLSEAKGAFFFQQNSKSRGIKSENKLVESV